MAAVVSVDPSSTISISNASKVCARTERIVSARYGSALYAGVMMLTAGRLMRRAGCKTKADRMESRQPYRPRNGWLDEKRVVLEILTGIQRAGADNILTYHAKDVARWLKAC